MGDYVLLRKTELRIDDIHLSHANLTAIAETAADVLGLERGEVLVADYRDGTLVLDLHGGRVDARAVVGRERDLIEGLGSLPGVRVTERTAVSSRGMLGWIGLERERALEALERGERMAGEILRNVARRAIVFSTGAEVERREIEDTNAPAIMRHLADEGFRVEQGGILEDDRVAIAARIREAAEIGGYGLIVTTGGVGAEDKDQTVEAVMEVDRDAAAPYVCHYEVGTGRHVKDGVRIAVGEYNGAMIVALPGPNDEVMASLEPLARGLKAGADKAVLAEAIAERLRSVLRERSDPPPSSHRH
ncbi:MAG: competence/damage-inducible protein A [Actinobacteria bacterium]|nr:competence/damage-inducible protein A [Actinomycetota bacterium]